MYPRTEYEMTEEDFKTLMDAMKPVPMIMLSGGYTPPSQQENANRAWEALGEKMGFDYNTVQPSRGKGERFFTAVPNEHEDHKRERLAKEAEEKKLAEINKIETEIADLQKKKSDLVATQGNKMGGE